MSETFIRENIDQLIDHFWQNGYLTLSRKYGTYLPDPNPIGSYSVDAVGRQNKRYAIGIVLTAEDLANEKIKSKLTYLASRQTKYSNKKVLLFVGVDKDNFYKAKDLIQKLNEDVKKNIKLVTLNEKNPSAEIIGRRRRDRFKINAYAA